MTGRSAGLRAGLVLALAASPLLAGCGGGQGEGQDAPVEVEVGQAFEWNGFSIADGWTLTSVAANRAGQDVEQPDLAMTVTNEGSTRFAVFAVVFVKADKAVATINCASSKLKEGQSEEVPCAGLGATFPTDYDRVLVQKVER